jgi:hypothetical protein
MNWGQDTESKSLDALQNAQYSPGRCPHQSKWIMAPACILQCRRTGDVAEKRSSMRVRWFACNNLLALRSGKWFCIRADHPGYPSTVPHTIPCQAYFSSPLGFNNIYNTTKHICISDYLYQGGHSSHKNSYTYSLRWSPLRALWQPLRWYQPSSTILFAHHIVCQAKVQLLEIFSISAAQRTYQVCNSFLPWASLQPQSQNDSSHILMIKCTRLSHLRERTITF